MTSLLGWANAVKLAVERLDRYLELTQAELDALPLYQFTVPTSPKPGFRYKRQAWKLPDGDRIYTAPNESSARYAINKAGYKGELEVVWYVYICEHDPKDRAYVVHIPKEVRVIP